MTMMKMLILACVLSFTAFTSAFAPSNVPQVMHSSQIMTPSFFALGMSSEEGDEKIHSGTVKWFNSLKGFGFVLPDEDGMPDVFVHQTDIYAEGFRSLADGEAVEYQLTTDARGRPKAIKVTGPGGAQVQGAPFRPANDYDNY